MKLTALKSGKNFSKYTSLSPSTMVYPEAKLNKINYINQIN